MCPIKHAGPQSLSLQAPGQIAYGTDIDYEFSYERFKVAESISKY